MAFGGGGFLVTGLAWEDDNASRHSWLGADGPQGLGLLCTLECAVSFPKTVLQSRTLPRLSPRL